MSRSLASLNVVIGAKISGFEKGLGKMERKLTRFQRKMSRIGTDLTQALTIPIVGAGVASVTTAAKYEALRVKMNALTGSAEEGGKAFERLVNFSAATPFQLDELVDVNNALLGFGLNADQAYVSTKRLADIAALTGGNMKNMAINFGAAAAEGRVMTKDIRQFINQGVPILDILADSMGVARGEILGMAEDGKISFDILDAAIKKATSAGGKFEGGTAKLANTLSGVFSTLKDNISIALGKVGESIVATTGLKEAMQDLSKFVGRAAEAFSQISPQLQSIIIKGGLFAAAIGPMLIILGKLPAVIGAILAGFNLLLPLISALISPVGLVVAAIGALAYGFSRLNAKKKEFIDSPIAKKLSGENRELNFLVNTLTEANLEQSERNGLIDEIIDIYPGFLGKLDKEKVTNEELRDRLREVNSEYLIKFKIAKSEDKLNKLLERQDELQEQSLEKIKEIEKLKTKSVDGEFGFNLKEGVYIFDRTSRDINEAQSSLSGYRSELEEVGFQIGVVELNLEAMTAAMRKNSKVIKKEDSPSPDKEKETTRLDGTPLAAFIGNIYLARNAFGEFTKDSSEKILSLGELMKENGMSLIESIINFAAAAQANYSKTASLVLQNFDAIAGGVHSLFEGIWDSIAAGENVFKGVISSLGKLIKKLVVAAIAAFALNSLLGGLGLGSFAEKLGNFKGIFASFTGLKLAKGGVTTGPTVAMIGDNASGRELVHPWERNKDFAADIARYMGGGGPAVPSVIKLVAEGGDLVKVMEWSQGTVRDSRGY